MAVNLDTAMISIHAPCEGSDVDSQDGISGTPLISIHAPCEGSDADSFSRLVSTSLFQSTLPVRGATARSIFLSGRRDFNPRSL